MRRILILLLATTGSIFTTAQVQETMHFHFDKQVYLPGETIWFKAYLYNSTMPAQTSTNLYTAVYNAAGKLLQQKQYPIFDGTATGDFVLPDTVENGTLIFRAFTKTSLQQDTAGYTHLLSVGGSAVNGPALKTAPAIASIHFFPEGGQLVADLNNFLGIRTAYSGGKPFAAKGSIKAGNTELAAFETDRNGMTAVQWTPEAGVLYHAEWTDENGRLLQADLPAVNSSGVLLHAETRGRSVYCMVSKNTMAAACSTLYLVAKQGTDTVYAARFDMDDAERAVSHFRTDSISTGMLQLTLCDAERRPLAQRTLYVNSAEPPLPVIIRQPTTATGPKEKNIIEIEVPDSVKTNLSVSIADADFYVANRASIRSNLLLGSGAQPQLPAEGDSTQTKYTDLLTLCNAWPSGGSFTAADNYLDISLRSKKNVSSKEVMSLIITDAISGRQFLSIPAAGSSFTKGGLVFYDSAKLHYQLQKDKEAVDEVVLAGGNELRSPETIVPPVNFVQQQRPVPVADTVFTRFVKNRPTTFNAVQTLQEVKVKSRYSNPATLRQQELENKYATGIFKGLGRGFFLNVMDDPSAEAIPDIFSYVAYRVPGIGVRTTLAGKIFVSGSCYPLIFINEQESPAETNGLNLLLQTLSITEIAYVKFISGIVIGPSFTTRCGVLYIYTKKGDEQRQPSKNMRTAFVKGYSSPRQFAQPDYTDKASLLNADSRSTLYWNPYVFTDAQNRKFTVEYYNNDLSKKLMLVIEGMDEKGRLVHAEKLIE